MLVGGQTFHVGSVLHDTGGFHHNLFEKWGSYLCPNAKRSGVVALGDGKRFRIRFWDPGGFSNEADLNFKHHCYQRNRSEEILVNADFVTKYPQVSKRS